MPAIHSNPVTERNDFIAELAADYESDSTRTLLHKRAELNAQRHTLRVTEAETFDAWGRSQGSPDEAAKAIAACGTRFAIDVIACSIDAIDIVLNERSRKYSR